MLGLTRVRGPGKDDHDKIACRLLAPRGREDASEENLDAHGINKRWESETLRRAVKRTSWSTAAVPVSEWREQAASGGLLNGASAGGGFSRPNRNISAQRSLPSLTCNLTCGDTTNLRVPNAFRRTEHVYILCSCNMTLAKLSPKEES